MSAIVWIVLAYVAGSIPFGLVVARGLKGVDPRTGGSRNIGATNVARLCGTGCGVAVLVLDIAKGFVPVAVAVAMSDSSLFPALIALAAVLGHMYSVFLRGTGGKAVATTVGAFLALAPWQLAVAAAACLAVIAWSGFVSLGSLTLVTALPVLLLVSGRLTQCLLAVVVMAFVYWKHRENIARLARGQEKPWRKPPPEPENAAR